MSLLLPSVRIAALRGLIPLVALTSALSAQTRPDSLSRLTRVMIIRQDVFDSTDADAWYARIANRLHVRTQARVVQRELLLRPGDLLDSARAAETGRNLRRLQVFRDVQVDTSTDGSALRIITRDGWTTRPYGNIRATGSQRLINAGLLESNFLGLAATLDLRYVQDPDRSQFRIGFGAPRLFANRISTGAFYNRLSDGRSSGAAIEQPFFALQSRNAARVGYVTFAGRVLRFRDGVLRAADSLDRRYTLVSAGAAHALHASPLGYLRIGGDVQYRRDDFSPRRGQPVVIPRTVTGAATGYVEYSKASFLLTNNFRMMGQPEDVNLSTTVRVGMAVAPAALGYDKSAVGPVLFAQTGLRIPSGFVSLTGRANALMNGGSVDSGTATVAGLMVLKPSPAHLIVAYTNFGWDRNPFPGEEFDLGFFRGPRAFPLHAFTGDRQRYTMLEYRWTVLPNILGNGAAGIAAFAETGGAWFSGSRPRDGHGAGVGLRLAPLRSAANIGATRIDLVRRFANDRERAGWVVVVGTGFTFDALR